MPCHFPLLSFSRTWRTTWQNKQCHKQKKMQLTAGAPHPPTQPRHNPRHDNPQPRRTPNTAHRHPPGRKPTETAPTNRNPHPTKWPCGRIVGTWPSCVNKNGDPCCAGGPACGTWPSCVNTERGGRLAQLPESRVPGQWRHIDSAQTNLHGDCCSHIVTTSFEALLSAWPCGPVVGTLPRSKTYPLSGARVS